MSFTAHSAVVPCIKLRDVSEGARFRLPTFPAVEVEFTRREFTKGAWTFSDLVRAEFQTLSGKQEQTFSADLEIIPIP